MQPALDMANQWCAKGKQSAYELNRAASKKQFPISSCQFIHVTNDSGQRVQGRTALQDEERHRTFVPDAPWPQSTAEAACDGGLVELQERTK